MSAELWYAAKCIFRYEGLHDDEQLTYEERIILVQADSFADAAALAEQEAIEYVHTSETCVYTGFMDVFHLAASAVGHGTEVYSLMRSSYLPTSDYLNTYYDTGAEHTRTFPTEE